MTLMEYLRTDEELKEYRRKWKEKLKEPFPPYNYDEFKGLKIDQEVLKHMAKIFPKVSGTKEELFKDPENRSR